MNDDDDDAALQFLQQQLVADAVPDNPALKSPYPVGFALDLALETAPLPDILASYELTAQDARGIFANEAFRREFRSHRQAMSVDGYSFKMKCKAQSEGYLKLLWNLAHAADTPAPVKAHIVANTVKWAALDNPVLASAASTSVVTPELLQQLQNMPDSELEVRIFSLLSRRTPKTKLEERVICVDDES